MQKLKDVNITPWTLDPVTKTKSRTTTYIKPLNLNIPFVPKEVPCTVLVTVSDGQKMPTRNFFFKCMCMFHNCTSLTN